MITFRISRKYVFRILFEFRMRQIRDTLFSYRMSVYFFPGMCVCVWSTFVCSMDSVSESSEKWEMKV